MYIGKLIEQHIKLFEDNGFDTEIVDKYDSVKSWKVLFVKEPKTSKTVGHFFFTKDGQNMMQEAEMLKMGTPVINVTEKSQWI